MIFENDTIVALATPPGVGALAIVRISGKDSVSIVDKIFKGKSKLSECDSHTIHYGKIFSSEELIDDVLVSIFKNPNSYTGEDSIEISSHGSPQIIQKIIEALLKYNVRNAEPGEFTKRAFLNGKLDLTQAEAVADIINARTEASLRGARNQLDGLLSKKIDNLKTKLVNVLSLLELELDFSEEGLEFVAKENVLSLVEQIKDEISYLISTFRFGKVIRDGINVAIVGEPNVGKSSLLNYLLKESRAIVSKKPGTTRDIIKEEVFIDGFLVRLFDTAGIRDTSDEIENEGVSRSWAAVKEADIIIFLNDIELGLSKKLADYLSEHFESERIIVVFNKVDKLHDFSFINGIKISALSGYGISDLVSEIKFRTLGTINYSEKSALISSQRHFIALNSSLNCLNTLEQSIQKDLSEEYLAVDIRTAVDFLNEIIGVVTSEDILNNVFKNFCIGK